MSGLTLAYGEQAEAGQQIGTVGSEVTPPARNLHIEVHSRNGRIYDDTVHPTQWLAENLGRDLTPERGRAVTQQTTHISTHAATDGPSTRAVRDWLRTAEVSGLVELRREASVQCDRKVDKLPERGRQFSIDVDQRPVKASSLQLSLSLGRRVVAQDALAGTTSRRRGPSSLDDAPPAPPATLKLQPLLNRLP